MLEVNMFGFFYYLINLNYFMFGILIKIVLVFEKYGIVYNDKFWEKKIVVEYYFWYIGNIVYRILFLLYG